MARILVIDDDAAVIRLLKRILIDAGHIVQGAPDGKSGLSSYRQQPMDLVITDIVMPDMEGLELITQLRRHDRGVKIEASRPLPCGGTSEELPAPDAEAEKP
jgi:CheY-like chemotaxis protein